MANALYAKYKEKVLAGGVSWTGDNIKVALVDADDYTVDLDADEFLDDIASGAIIATSANLGSKTVTGGVADAANVTFTAVSGDISEALVIFKDTGTASTSPLIAYIDDADGLAVTPNGGDITVIWPDDGIFEL
ncbi:minor tail protein [Mycobacterium phage Ryadel]|uniref:Minor tail subunit n=6 Tax=Viruses TaxID=10239 RepID=S5Y883_9CAUD|nr:minor tail subunit [Mycobacterium phage Dylan]YP_009014424.1 hypothetical protein CL96_gp061 [Mycobacterium phage Firecracker]YP_010097554.1 minor tail protein [Mycobacterium phage Ryadel]AII28304.1 minor tail protein [Mycobacterium phage YungJamal]ALA48902.1 minor tail subunit [Mycobacterium phage Zakhe101]ATW60543.1 minor tail protein [Mycobacterium phage Familton]QFP96554.1 hypothetical protein SEA_SMOOCH_63 [Mycobacterium phage Smooch]WUT94707.1 minor tail protein [Mycobacterium phage